MRRCCSAFSNREKSKWRFVTDFYSQYQKEINLNVYVNCSTILIRDPPRPPHSQLAFCRALKIERKQIEQKSFDFRPAADVDNCQRATSLRCHSRVNETLPFDPMRLELCRGKWTKWRLRYISVLLDSLRAMIIMTCHHRFEQFESYLDMSRIYRYWCFR